MLLKQNNHNIIEVLLVDSEEKQTLPYKPDMRIADIKEKVCKKRGLNAPFYRMTLSGSLASLNEEMTLAEIPNFKQKLEMHCENSSVKASARELRHSVNVRKLAALRGEKVLTKTESLPNLNSTIASLGSDVEVPKGFRHRCPDEFPRSSLSEMLYSVKEALAKYNIFDDEKASLENSSVSAAFGVIAGGALAPSVAVFPLMFPEAQGWLSFGTSVATNYNVWVSIGILPSSKSKTGDYMVGYKTIPQPVDVANTTKKVAKPAVAFYISLADIESVYQKKSTSSSFTVTLKDKTKLRFRASGADGPLEAVRVFRTSLVFGLLTSIYKIASVDQAVVRVCVEQERLE